VPTARSRLWGGRRRVIPRLAAITVLIFSSAGAGQVAVPQRVRLSTALAEKLLVKRVNPDYPKDLRKKHIQGIVVMSVRISKQGDVIDVKLVSGPPALAPNAIDAVKQWKYKPYLLNGEAVEADTTVLVNFTLAGS
jgi:periplasmic protein TonB